MGEGARQYEVLVPRRRRKGVLLEIEGPRRVVDETADRLARWQALFPADGGSGGGG